MHSAVQLFTIATQALKDGSAEVVQTTEYIGRNVTGEAERATALAKRLEKKTARAR